MAKQQVEFTMSLKELSFSFKGDRETGEALSKGITQTLDAIHSTQQAALNGNSQSRLLESGEVIDVAPEKSVRRRRKKKNGDASATGSGENGGARELLLKLKSEGFFAEGRLVKDIKHRLGELGHSVPGLTSVLVRLTKDGALTRVQDPENNQWSYRTSPTS